MEVIMNKRLILFSGQLDSIENTLKIVENKDYLFDMLYIKNISFRNNETIPIQIFKELMKEYKNVRHFYIADGKKIQNSFLEYYFKIYGTDTTVNMLCTMCQLEINLIYAYFLKKFNYLKIIPNIYIRTDEKLLYEPYKILLGDEYRIIKDNDKYNYKMYNKLIPLVNNNCKCQLAISHSYYRNLNDHSKIIRSILEMFVNNDILSQIEIKKIL